MPARTNAFQRLVALLTATFAGQAKVSESAMLLDRVTGELREVDVIVISDTASYQVHLSLEVVAWSRPADTPWIEKMYAKHQNLATDKLILVSESGFSKPALRKAQFLGIETLTVEEACGADWPMIAALEGSGVFDVVTMNFDVAAVCQFSCGTKEQLPIPATDIVPTRLGPMSMDAFVRRLLNTDLVQDTVRAHVKGGEERSCHLSYTDANGLWKIDQGARSGEILELLIGLKVVRTTSPVRYAAGKFRSVPFVSGMSTEPAGQLQFVLARNPDGSSSGYLIDSNGLRSLSVPP